jgi:hypothetical protein
MHCNDVWDSNGSWQKPCKQVCCGLGMLLLQLLLLQLLLLLLLLLPLVTPSHTKQCDYLTHGHRQLVFLQAARRCVPPCQQLAASYMATESLLQ